MPFLDHYSAIAERYARHRPRYPDALFREVARAAPGRRVCWDVATGSGQAAASLAQHFDRVVATDASEQQVGHGIASSNIEYRVEPAERSSLRDQSVDAVTIASGLHWLDREAFYTEVHRVARPGAVVAAWTYGAEVTGGRHIQQAVQDLVDGPLKPFWDPALDLVMSGYRTVPFPFPEQLMPPMAIEVAWGLSDLMEHIRTWSGSSAFEQAHGAPVTVMHGEAMRKAWARDAGQQPTMALNLPLYVRMGRVPRINTAAGPP